MDEGPRFQTVERADQAGATGADGSPPPSTPGQTEPQPADGESKPPRRSPSRRTLFELGGAVLLVVLAVVAGLVVSGRSPTKAVQGEILGVETPSQLMVGFADYGSHYEPDRAAAAAKQIGATLMRFSLWWSPGLSQLTPQDATLLQQTVAADAPARVMVTVSFDKGVNAPVTDAARNQFCTYARNVLEVEPKVNDIEIGNEPNYALFWSPVNPAAYEQLLALCYDVLHAARSTVNVIGFATAPHPPQMKPPQFIAGVGAAYKQSGRTQPLMDTFSSHAYQENYPALMDAYKAAFAGTHQQIPTAGTGPKLWYTEGGFQGDPSTQASKLQAELTKVATEPGVAAWVNLQPWDLTGPNEWRAGFLTNDGSPKPALSSFKSAISNQALR
jgi:hypothetical protein